jgi:nucleoside-diphosphate-sugar epimerase
MSYAVVGANGQIGGLLVAELLGRGQDVVAVGRAWAGEPFGSSVNYRVADAAQPDQLRAAVAGAGTVFAVLGLPYRPEVWEAQWMPMMRNVLGTTLSSGARLVYLDNVYAYGLVDGWMTETTPQRPNSRMGRVRAQVADLLLDAVATRHARVLIARSADFVGPGAATSIAGSRLFAGVINKTGPKRRAEWLGDPKTRHCWAGTPSIAAALATLGAAEDADYGQVWHLPTYGPMTGYQFCQTLGKVAGCQVIPRPLTVPMLRLIGIVNPQARASAEMLYQSTNDYLFSDEKFRGRFPDFRQDSFADLLANTLKYFATSPTK